MPRPTDLFLNGRGYAQGRNNPMIDIANGGQFGWMPDFPAYVSNSAHVDRNRLIALLVEPPRLFTKLPDSAKWISTLKSLIELHPLRIEGLNAGLEVEYQEHAFGAAGEMQSEVSNVTRARSTPSFTYTEKYGRPINAFYNGWIQWLLGTPENKVPLITTLGAGVESMLSDDLSATVLFFDTDPTFTQIDKAWLMCDMKPKADGGVEGRRDLTSGGQLREIQIEMTGIAQFGNGPRQFAQKLLDGMNVTGANAANRPAFVQQIQSDVLAAAQGYAEQIRTAARTAV